MSAGATGSGSVGGVSDSLFTAKRSDESIDESKPEKSPKVASPRDWGEWKNSALAGSAKVAGSKSKPKAV